MTSQEVVVQILKQSFLKIAHFISYLKVNITLLDG